MADDVEHLVEILELEPIEFNIFRGVTPDWHSLPRVFGGQVAAQALMAAGNTVETGRVHSLHAYFLRGGDPTIPILYEVDRIRDGRSFTTRRVVAIQRGEAILNLDASFHVDEPGPTHQVPMREVPPPEELPTLKERLEPFAEEVGEFLSRPHPIDQRFIGELPWVRTGKPRPACQSLWIKANGSVGDDPLLNACVITYASDMSLFDSMLFPHNLRWDDPGFMGASLDHCMWFHRPVRADEWIFYDQESPVAYGARGLSTARMYDRSGNLAVSLAQEGLMRVRRSSS
jgi:acyl-CoA thioesterase-2